MIVVNTGEATTAGSNPILSTTSTKMLAISFEKNTVQITVNDTTSAT